MKKVYVFMANGFEEIEAITVVDVLKRAGLEVEMISVTKEDMVAGAHDVPLLCDAKFEGYKLDDAVAVILPGGMPGAETLSNHEGLMKLVEYYLGENKLVAAICAAPMALGKRGLLKGKKVTCYPGFESYLEGAEVTGTQVQRDGNIITGRGPGAAMDFSLAIVEYLFDASKVRELKDAMCVIS